MKGLTAELVVKDKEAASSNGRVQESGGFLLLHSYPEPQVEAKWHECLAHADLAAHHASPAFFKELYFHGKRPFAVLALMDGEVVGVLTGLHEGNTVVSGLESRVHIVTDRRRDQEKIAALLARGVEEESRGAKMVRVYSWGHLPMAPFTAKGYRRREFPGNPIFDLSAGAEAIAQGFGKSQRHNVRLARKSGVEIVEATTKEEFEIFFGIYEQWCAAKKTFQYSREIEWETFQTTQSHRRYFLAMHEGKAIAGSVVRFYPGGLIECSRNSSLPEYRHLKPNDLLIAFTIEWGCRNGFQSVSLNAHHKFLRGFGGQMTPIDRYRKDRTLLRQHDLEDAARDFSREMFYRLPERQQQRVRKLLRLEKPAGW